MAYTYPVSPKSISLKTTLISVFARAFSNTSGRISTCKNPFSSDLPIPTYCNTVPSITFFCGFWTISIDGSSKIAINVADCSPLLISKPI